MGGKRKKRTKIIRPKPKLPKTFECPKCGKIAIDITFKDIDENDDSGRKIKLAKIKCGNCGLYAEIEVPKVFDEANAYGKFIDGYYNGTLEIKDTHEEEINDSNEDEREDKQLHSAT
ncbi:MULTISPECIES: transcription elongation factor [Acidianus]|uniref:Transcription elongation factor n=1 Tax=Candidatus Acidianus copahuensis TaxID=1160895 RepID=A0A031LND1_9CREN|nr:MULTISPECIES: transcription elongation factor [Acidianus]EZQ03049.1 transcription elongation factor [Candidatus Acidianus copahuensis]NON62460.1 transcription elongation factor [Acidianus sp. RZ1]